MAKDLAGMRHPLIVDAMSVSVILGHNRLMPVIAKPNKQLCTVSLIRQRIRGRISTLVERTAPD